MVARSTGHGRPRAVPGQHHHRVGQRQDLGAQAVHHASGSPPGRSVRPIEPANRTSPEKTSGSWSRSGGEHRRARGVPGRVGGDEVDPGHRDERSVVQLATSSGSTNPERPGASWGNSARSPRPSSATGRQQSAVVRMHPARGLGGPAERGDRPHVVEMPVGDHHRDRLQPVLGNQVRDADGGVHPRIDDHALRSAVRGHHVAVGLPRPSGKEAQRARGERIGQDGCMTESGRRTWATLPPSAGGPRRHGLRPHGRGRAQRGPGTRRPQRRGPWPSSPGASPPWSWRSACCRPDQRRGALPRRRAGLGPHGTGRRGRGERRG